MAGRKRPPGFSPDLLALLIDADEPRAIRTLKALRRQIRANPELAARFQLDPPPSRGRPAGSRGDFAMRDLCLALFVDLLGLPNAAALRALELDASSGASTNFQKLARRLQRGRAELDRAFSEAPEAHELFVAQQQALTEEDRSRMTMELRRLKLKAILFDASSEDEPAGGAPPP